MKKLFLISIILLSTFSYAGEWSKIHKDADELLGTGEYTIFAYEEGDMTFVYYSDDSIFVLINDNEIFNCEYDSYYGGFGIMATVGLYDSSSKLIEKGSLYMSSGDDLHRISFHCFRIIPNQVGWKTRIMNHLQTDGHIRILTYLYPSGTFDLTIPCGIDNSSKNL